MWIHASIRQRRAAAGSSGRLATVTSPTAPIELTGTDERFGPGPVEFPDALRATLAAICEVRAGPTDLAEASRDWWPIALHWSLAGEVPRRAALVCRPATTEQIAAVLRACNESGMPVTTAGGRSGVCGASIPLFGGVILDTTAMQGIVSVDAISGIVEVLPGTFGSDLERTLRAEHHLTVGHWPQSMDISTVGGWLACRGAGQYSTRYGKIDHLVVGVEAVLADGSVLRSAPSPAASAGPDLTQLLLGSEGTLAVISRVWLRARPEPVDEFRAAYAIGSFPEGIELCRAILRRGATPAVLRLYDAQESARGHDGDGRECIVLVLDEGDPAIVGASATVVGEEAARLGARPLGDELVGRWLVHRNDTSGLQALTRKGLVVDTMEIAAPWSRLVPIFDRARAALLAVPGARVASCHLSHSYVDGACLYFTFAATPERAGLEGVEEQYRALWDAGTRAVLSAGGNLSHHHGVGLNRSRFIGEALGATGAAVLAAVKAALDPQGILNPGKLGIASRFGSSPW